MKYAKMALVLSAMVLLLCPVEVVAQESAPAPSQLQAAPAPAQPQPAPAPAPIQPQLPPLPTQPQVPPVPSQPQAAATPEAAGTPTTAQLTDEQRAAMAPFLSDPADQNKVADLRDLLRDRIFLVQAGNQEADVENAGAVILLTLSTLPADKREATLKALDEIWNMREDYYDELLDVMNSLYRYRAWLGPDRYDRLSSQREFLVRYQQDFSDWREQQPPRPWRYGEVLVKAPVYAPPAERAAQPVQPAYTPPPTGYMAQQFPYTSTFPKSSLRGQPGPIFVPRTLPQNPAAPRIIVPNLRAGQGPGPVPAVPVYRQSRGQ